MLQRTNFWAQKNTAKATILKRNLGARSNQTFVELVSLIDVGRSLGVGPTQCPPGRPTVGSPSSLMGRRAFCVFRPKKVRRIRSEHLRGIRVAELADGLLPRTLSTVGLKPAAPRVAGCLRLRVSDGAVVAQRS